MNANVLITAACFSTSRKEVITYNERDKHVRCFVHTCAQYILFMQDGLTGSAWGDWANYTASPLRAFENELGVQAPVGFWDPAGALSCYFVFHFIAWY